MHLISYQPVDFIQQHIDDRVIFLVLLNLFLLTLGMMLDILSALVIFVASGH